jgi:hypothetical protein
MEVHSHSHAHGKKNWKSYFWEFLMLFLAVFCGFLAENQREKIVEHHREKEFARSLLEDLSNDTLDINQGGIPFWTKYGNRIDTLRDQIDKEENERDLKLMYSIVPRLTTNFSFRYHDRTVMQLKAGNFRLIQSKMVADSLVEYDAVYNTLLKNIEQLYNSFLLRHLALRDQLFSSRYFSLANNPERLDSAFKADPGAFVVRKGKEEVLFEYYNFLYDLRWHSNARIYFLTRQQKWATSLIGLIKEEYHLK